ncbi:PhoU family transcriptional regulator [Candidatus Bathyarchaeota archaeon]|nr:MAG: PhoU family transcriptional regulator [Candidatus Bathyarchaeota archaeon]
MAEGRDTGRFERICNDLVELKDTSELMMDLAYSALLLNSRELAEEVRMLEEKVDRLHTEFELLVLSSCVKPEDARGLLGLIRMGVVTEQIADAAAEIAEVVLRGEEPHPVLRMVIKDADETVERAVVSEDSPLVGKTLKEARIPEETGMWVLVIRRGDRWMRPRPGTRIQAGDVIIASGYADGEEDFRKLIGCGS